VVLVVVVAVIIVAAVIVVDGFLLELCWPLACRLLLLSFSILSPTIPFSFRLRISRRLPRYLDRYLKGKRNKTHW
jgi:hypothetical protein